ncbi:hypothetical protein M427DRAFT_65856 [Gonapodya prolifera JEL478]|uniref:Uncharacterized protein n=1 Tax=Gonapodya prolifera (strain JEL478) TaxID=1344416 RepID=A0A139AYZ0_GONPJ|nr:hypothetical protein M427DRAFT_65856 [Gonapodya prolifera JEL478]|eukprot:KXS21968.1 hypothetical protein M427DRAFT_65856 [Gonapodya prolifera JEL478]
MEQKQRVNARADHDTFRMEYISEDTKDCLRRAITIANQRAAYLLFHVQRATHYYGIPMKPIYRSQVLVGALDNRLKWYMADDLETVMNAAAVEALRRVQTLQEYNRRSWERALLAAALGLERTITLSAQAVQWLFAPPTDDTIANEAALSLPGELYPTLKGIDGDTDNDAERGQGSFQVSPGLGTDPDNGPTSEIEFNEVYAPSSRPESSVIDVPPAHVPRAVEATTAEIWNDRNTTRNATVFFARSGRAGMPT